MSTPSSQLLAYREVWERKAVLRELYADYYRRMAKACVPGKTLEIGGGVGNFKDFAEGTLSTDIQFAPWLDLVADAQGMPFGEASFDNIVMMDVLHHIESPRKLLSEAERLLRPHGRIVMLEPAVTPVSNPFYTHFHPEPVDMTADPLADIPSNAKRPPYDANTAIPALLFGKYLARLEREFPNIHLIRVEWMTALTYLLSGGFREWSLLPRPLLEPLLALDQGLSPLFGRLMGFRVFSVLEKK